MGPVKKIFFVYFRRRYLEQCTDGSRAHLRDRGESLPHTAQNRLASPVNLTGSDDLSLLSENGKRAGGPNLRLQIPFLHPVGLAAAEGVSRVSSELIHDNWAQDGLRLRLATGIVMAGDPEPGEIEALEVDAWAGPKYTLFEVCRTTSEGFIRIVRIKEGSGHCIGYAELGI